MDFTKKVYHFKDIPEKRKYIFDRTKKIYDIDDSLIDNILDSIKIVFREQDEKGASNHTNRTVYVSLNELDKYNIKDEKSFFKYLNYPKSVVTHEVTHIFQNLFKAFPDVKYVSKDKNGKWIIDYTKYRTDKGEIQSRLEQCIEMLKWGFSKEEIINFLYSRKYNDKGLWKILLDCAENLKKESSSKLPGIDENEDVENEDNRSKSTYHRKDRGNNYEKDYMSGGTLSLKDK